MNIRFTIPGQPVTKKNSQRLVRAGGKTIPLPSKAFSDYQDAAGYCIPTKRRVDLLNLLGATCDILTHYGVIKDDNSAIVVSHDGSRVLHDKENPRVEISIEEVAE